MMKHFSYGSDTAERKHFKKLGPLPEEEVARRQLMRDVINRLDYDDVKTSMTHGRRCPNEAIMAHSHRKPKKGAVTPALEVIIPKLECILKDLRAAEEKNSPRMRHIDHSLAELSAAKAEEH